MGKFNLTNSEEASESSQPLLDTPTPSMACSNITIHALVRTNQEALISPSEQGGLNRCLSWYDLIAYGVATTIGAGLFVVTGEVANLIAGPATIFSFIIAAFSSLLSAFCYAEFSARVPLSGSAYSFSYVALGEIIAWFVGWNLTLEYMISASAVARAWASNVYALINSFFPSLVFPTWAGNGYNVGKYLSFSPFSVVIVFASTFILLFGVQGSAKFNLAMTITNTSLILFIVVVGSFKISPSNWSPFFPYGASGVLEGAGRVFFSYIGFDSVTTLAGEVKKPARDLPVGIVATLFVVTILYVLFTLVLTGMQPYDQINPNTPAVSVFQAVGLDWVADIVAIGVTTTLTANVFTTLMAQPRVFYQMARDGLLYEVFGQIDERSTPIVGTILSGFCAALFCAVLSLGDLTSMISIGTLMAFTVVSGGVLVLRYQHPIGKAISEEVSQHESKIDAPLLLVIYWVVCTISAATIKLKCPAYLVVLFFLPVVVIFVWFCTLFETRSVPETFKCPWVPLVPCLATYINILLICLLPVASFIRVVLWSALGFFIYFTYGVHHSKVGLLERTRLKSINK